MGKYLDSGGLSHLIAKIKALLAGKQDTLVSGTNIKTVNNTSLLGSGNITISGGGSTAFDNEGLPIGSGSNEVVQYRHFSAYSASGSYIQAGFVPEDGVDYSGETPPMPPDADYSQECGTRVYVNMDLSTLITASGMGIAFYDATMTNQVLPAAPLQTTVWGGDLYNLAQAGLGLALLNTNATYELRYMEGCWLEVGGDMGPAWVLMGNPFVTSSSGGGGRQSTWYGTSSTAASTAAKVISGVTGWTPAAGDILTVYFSTANTASVPTLNINSTTYSIRIGNSAPVNTTNVLKWSAYTTVTFVYDGTYFRYIAANSAASVDQPRGAATWYGTSSTATATTAKASTIANFVLTKGARVAVKFTYGNTANAPTLNVNSTGAKNMRVNGANVSASNPLYWSAGSMLEFVYDGTGWNYIGGDKGAISKHAEYGEDGDWLIEPNQGWTVTVNDYFTYGGLLIAQLGISANGTASAGTTYNPFTISGVKMAFFVNDTAQGGMASMTNGAVWVSVQRTFSANTVFNVWMFAVLA